MTCALNQRGLPDNEHRHFLRYPLLGEFGNERTSARTLNGFPYDRVPDKGLAYENETNPAFLVHVNTARYPLGRPGWPDSRLCRGQCNPLCPSSSLQCSFSINARGVSQGVGKRTFLSPILARTFANKFVYVPATGNELGW
jgi:hypothetical protein